MSNTKINPRITEIENLCHDLIDSGLPYAAVIIGHELFRFLYPVEPYCDFRHSNPVKFMEDHFNRLIELGKSFNKSISGYDDPLPMFCKESNQDSLEIQTSDLYSKLWSRFNDDTLIDESITLLKNRITQIVIDESIVGKKILDMGCGSGRYTIALAKLGAKKVIGVDYQKKSFLVASEFAKQTNLNVEFRKADVLDLPFEDNFFDFIFCNGVLHHTHSIEQGMKELKRVLKHNCKAFLYLYAIGGVFWDTRVAMRRVFSRIPEEYTQTVLQIIGVPANRFIFMDTWYVPIETLTSKFDLESLMESLGFQYKKLRGKNAFDLDQKFSIDKEEIEFMWGDGEHRYLLEKSK